MLWACAAYSQVATGTISGTVRDNSGAVLPGVTVVIQNQDTGISRTVLTNEAGYYSAPSLGVGQYGLMVSLPGFQTVERTGMDSRIAMSLSSPLLPGTIGFLGVR